MIQRIKFNGLPVSENMANDLIDGAQREWAKYANEINSEGGELVFTSLPGTSTINVSIENISDGLKNKLASHIASWFKG
jgi:hypothetical protein